MSRPRQKRPTRQRRLALTVAIMLTILGMVCGSCEVRLLNYQWTCTDVINLSIYAAARNRFNVTIFEPNLPAEPNSMEEVNLQFSDGNVDMMTTYIVEAGSFPQNLHPVVTHHFDRELKLFAFDGTAQTINVDLIDVKNNLNQYVYNSSLLVNAIPKNELPTECNSIQGGIDAAYVLYPTDISSFRDLCPLMKQFAADHAMSVIPVGVSNARLETLVRSLLFTSKPFLFATAIPSKFSNTDAMGFQEVVQEGRSLTLQSVGSPKLVVTNTWYAKAQQDCPEFLSFLEKLMITTSMVDAALKSFGDGGTNVPSDSSRMFEVSIVSAAYNMTNDIEASENLPRSSLLTPTENDVNPVVIPKVATTNITYSTSSKKDGDTIIVAMWTCEPFVRCRDGSVTTQVKDGVNTSTINAEGFFIDVWGQVLETAHISADQEIEYRCYSSAVDIWQDISYGLIDVFISCAFVNADRSSKMHSVPLYDGGSRILTIKQMPHIQHWWFVDVFSSGVWLLFLFFLVLSSGVLLYMFISIRTLEGDPNATSTSPDVELHSVAYHRSRQSRHNSRTVVSHGDSRDTRPRSLGTRVQNFFSAYSNRLLWTVFTLTANPDTEDAIGDDEELHATVRHRFARALVGIANWSRLLVIVLSILILSVYTANLAASITTASFMDVIEEPSDLVNRAVTSICNSTSDTWIRQTSLHNGSYHCVHAVSDGVRQVLRREVEAFVYDDAVLRWWAQHSCDIDPVGVLFAPQNYGFFFSPSFEMVDLFQAAIGKLSAADKFTELASEYIPASTDCIGEGDNFHNSTNWPLKHRFSKDASFVFFDDTRDLSSGPSEIHKESMWIFFLISGGTVVVVVIAALVICLIDYSERRSASR